RSILQTSGGWSSRHLEDGMKVAGIVFGARGRGGAQVMCAGAELSLLYEECGPMRLVQSQAAVARPRPGRPQKGCGIGKLAFALSLACLFAAASAGAQNAYITNDFGRTVSVIDTATNTVVGSPIPVGLFPFGVAVTPDGSKVYVTNLVSNTVSVIDTA